MTNNDISNEVRELSASEVSDVGGGGISFGAWISRMIWQLQNAEEGIECDKDWGVCATPSK